MSTNPKLRVAIIGGGIGGLTLAAALRFMGNEQKFDVHIYESSSFIAEIGAGISFWPRSWRIMKAIGADDKLFELLSEVPDDSTKKLFNVRKGDQPHGVHIQDLLMNGAAARFHRAELLQVLYEKSMGEFHLSHRFLSYEDVGSEVILKFENGVTTTCDILVGVDGMRSTVRGCFLEKQGHFMSPSCNPYWSGAYAHRGLIPVEDLQKEFPGHNGCKEAMMYCGKFKHIVTYLVSNNKLINVVAMTSDLSKEFGPVNGPTAIPVTQNELLAAFKDWEPEVQAILRCIKKPMRYTLQAIRPLELYAKKRIFLLGDAAHGMTPHQGSGAGAAVEDAYILASLLSSQFCTKSKIPAVANVYDSIRRPGGNQAIERARAAGRLCQIAFPGYEDVEVGADVSIERLQSLVDMMAKNWEWCWQSAEDDKQRALEMIALEIPKASY